MSITITRGSHVIQLTEQEISYVAQTALRRARMETCFLMTRSFLENMGILETSNLQQIEFFMGQVIPEAEQERLSVLYEARKNDYAAPYDLWMSILGSQMYQKNSLMCRTMRRIIFDHCSVKHRTAIMNSRQCNPYRKSNFDAVLADMSALSLVEIWKKFRFIEQL